ncbi:MAG: MetQ/NlpA family ABC transporter substrate-binding protein [Anaerorhabdus sp.]
MKKFIKSIAVIGLCFAVVGCTSGGTDDSSVEPTGSTEDTTIVVAATLDPHSKILEFAAPLLEEKGYTLEIIVLDDYYVFNESLNSGEVDANFFQHVPFFNSEIEAKGYDIVNVAGIHIEPLGFYSKTISDISELQDNAEIVITNTITDQGRTLSILEKNGLIELSADVDALTATISDITVNPKNLQFKEVSPELLTTIFEQGEGDLVAINGNYALQAGLNPVTDSVILEEADSTNPYVNIIAARTDNQDSDKIKALVEVLTSAEVKTFIEETYSDGSVIPAK